MSVTRKPCPGCVAVKRARKADEVCAACAATLKGWKAHVESLQEQSTKGECVFVLLPERDYAWPGFYFGGPRAHIPGFDELRDTLLGLMHRLSHRMCEVLPEGTHPVHKAEKLFQPPDRDFPMSEGQHGWWTVLARIYPADLELLRGLWSTVAQFVHVSYMGGREDGRNLLLEMASGEISSQDFAAKDLKMAKQVQEAGRRQKGTQNVQDHD